jgi:hypothetical protein
LELARLLFESMTFGGSHHNTQRTGDHPPVALQLRTERPISKYYQMQPGGMRDAVSDRGGSRGRSPSPTSIALANVSWRIVRAGVQDGSDRIGD